MTTIFGTVVLVVIPALLVHRMLAFHHYLVIFLERSLTEITRLRYRFPSETHLAATVLNDIPTQKEAVSDVGFQKLENAPYQQDHEQSNHDANGDELDHGTVTYDNRAVDCTQREFRLSLCYQVAGSLVVKRNLEDMTIATEDFMVRLFQNDLIVGKVVQLIRVM